LAAAAEFDPQRRRAPDFDAKPATQPRPTLLRTSRAAADRDHDLRGIDQGIQRMTELLLDDALKKLNVVDHRTR
jgi:hypothetical protein